MVDNPCAETKQRDFSRVNDEWSHLSISPLPVCCLFVLLPMLDATLRTLERDDRCSSRLWVLDGICTKGKLQVGPKAAQIDRQEIGHGLVNAILTVSAAVPTLEVQIHYIVAVVCDIRRVILIFPQLCCAARHLQAGVAQISRVAHMMNSFSVATLAAGSSQTSVRPISPLADSGSGPGCTSSRTAQFPPAWPLHAREDGRVSRADTAVGIQLTRRQHAGPAGTACHARLLPPRPFTSFVSSTMHTNFVAAISTICASAWRQHHRWA